MACPGEFLCAVFADGELPETEARQVVEHLETCRDCADLVRAFRNEAGLLVQAFQNVDLTESEPQLSSQHSISPARFGVGVLGIAVGLRLAFGIAFGLELPTGLEWLDPRSLSMRLGVVVDALSYAIENGGSFVTNAMYSLSLAVLGTVVLAGIVRVVRKAPTASAILGTLLACVIFSSSAYAIEVRGGRDTNIPEGTTIDGTLIVAGDAITVHGTVKGDLIAAGRHVIVTGTVEGDVLAAAQLVEIRGKVGGNVFGGAETVLVSGEVARNVYGYARAVTLANSGRIGGDVTAFAANVIVDGVVGRDVMTLAGTFDIHGEVSRNTDFRGGMLSVTSPGRIGGALNAYVNEKENVRIDSGAFVGSRNIQIREPEPSKYSTVRFYFWQIVRLAAFLVTGLFLFWLFPRLVPGSSAIGHEWLKAGGIGFAATVVLPVASLFASITVIGLPLGLAGFVLCLAGLYASKILVADFLGRAIVNEGRVMPLLMGLVVILVAVNLPYVGGLINWLLMFVGFGALLMTIYRAFRTPALPL